MSKNGAKQKATDRWGLSTVGGNARMARKLALLSLPVPKSLIAWNSTGNVPQVLTPPLSDRPSAYGYAPYDVFARVSAQALLLIKGGPWAFIEPCRPVIV